MLPQWKGKQEFYWSIYLFNLLIHLLLKGKLRGRRFSSDTAAVQAYEQKICNMIRTEPFCRHFTSDFRWSISLLQSTVSLYQQNTYFLRIYIISAWWIRKIVFWFINLQELRQIQSKPLWPSTNWFLNAEVSVFSAQLLNNKDHIIWGTYIVPVTVISNNELHLSL